MSETLYEPHVGGIRMACPACSGALDLTDTTACCGDCGATYTCDHGIWRFLLPQREACFATFLQGYNRIRADQGWGETASAYYQHLPHVASDDQQKDIWHAREVHTAAFIRDILTPLEVRDPEPLRILDLGAGNCWLSNRLSERGHHVAAVDINTDPVDGLGAWRHYVHRFLKLNAEFERLPLAPNQFDLVIFNAAFHYSLNYTHSLMAALRTLKDDGLVVIMDSPFYRHENSGQQMVRERMVDYAKRYNVATNVLGAREYLSQHDLNDISHALSVTPHFVWPLPAWRRRVRALRNMVRRRRETAQFPLIVINPYPVWSPGPAHRVIRRIFEPLLRLRYQVIDRQHAHKATTRRVAGRTVQVFPYVFDPHLFGTGEWLARKLSGDLIPLESRVLDLGTGSGIGAIFAAQWARQVIATDINPAAVACTQANIAAQGLQDRITVRLGNLFDPVAGERFDVVVFNPPYFRGEPSTPYETAFMSTDISQRFAAGLADHLTPHGWALLVLSDRGETAAFLHALRTFGFMTCTIAARVMLTERITLYRVSAMATEAPAMSEHETAAIAELERMP